MSRPSSRRLILSGYSFAQAVCACAVQGSALSLRAGVGSQAMAGSTKTQVPVAAQKFPNFAAHIGNGHMYVLPVSAFRSHGLCHSIQ